MPAFKHIVFVGTGQVGKPIYQAILATGRFDLTILARPTSTVQVPEGVKLIKVDYTSHSLLVEALRGNDVVILCFGDLGNLVKTTTAFVDAAIEAGVKRIIPSEWSGDTRHPPGSEEKLFAARLEAAAYYEKAAAGGKITYTTVTNGVLIDLVLTSGFLGVDFKARKATLYDGGKRKQNMTTLGGVAHALVSILDRPEETKNKDIRVHDFFVSIREILDIIEGEWGTFETINVDVAELQADAQARLAQGERSREVARDLIIGAFAGERSGYRWGEDDDSRLLELPPVDLKGVVLKCGGPMV